ncbi:MAG TPA: glycosyltransferase family 87 protein [Polyangiales bacterium]
MAGPVALLVGLCASLFNYLRGGVDYAVLHAMALGLANGTNVYELNAPDAVSKGVVGMVYPPATAFVVWPLAYLPYDTAKTLFCLIMNVVLISGVRALVRDAVPRAPAGAWMLAVGVVLASASIRWGMMLLQVAPLMLGLLCWFLVLLWRRPRAAVAVAALATAFKMTLALPFLGVLLLHRRFVGLVVAGGTWVALNALGFLRFGPLSFATYRANVAGFEANDASWNINGPDPWVGTTLPRLDWAFLFFGIFGSVPVSRIGNLLASGLTALWLLREGLRAGVSPSRATTLLFLAPLVCLGSLCVYHHQYDACLYFAPLLLGFAYLEHLQQPRWALWCTAPLAVLITVFPIGAVQALLLPRLGLVGVGLMKLTFPVTFTLALIGSLALLRRNLAAAVTDPEARESSGQPAPAEP